MSASLRELAVEPGGDVFQHAGPTAPVVLGGGLIEQLLVLQRQKRAGAVGRRDYGDLGFALRRRMPGPAEHQLLVRDDFLVDAAHFEMLAVAVGEAEAETASG